MKIRNLGFYLASSLLSLVAPRVALGQKMIVGQYWNNLATAYSMDGTSLGTFCSSTGTARFYGMTSDSMGDVYVAGEFTNNVRRFSSTGADLGNFAVTSGNTGGLAFDSQGDLYVGEDGGVQKFSANGTNLGLFAPVSGSAYGVAVDASGNVYVSDIGDTVHKYSSTGTDLGVFASGLSGAQDLKFDAAGDLLVAERGAYGSHHDIHRFSATGADLGGFGGSVLGDPVELAIDSAGNIYVSDIGKGEVRRFSANGADLGNFATNIASPSGLTFLAVPEPCSLLLLGLGSLVTCRAAAKKKLRLRRGL